MWTVVFQDPFLSLPTAPPRYKYPPVPHVINLFTHVDDLLPCSVTNEASIQDSIYLLQELAEKDIRYLKENNNHL